MQETTLFVRQFLRGWRSVGSVVPSSGPLGRAMIDALGAVGPGQVVLELGPGTGVFTRQLVQRFPQARIVAVELNDEFAASLPNAVPGATIVHGCASKLTEHLGKLGYGPTDVAGVLSGLPLLSLPGDLPGRMLAAIADVLPAGRPYVQLTYSERAWRKFDVAAAGFRRHPYKRVWPNVPPAFVLPFTREPSPVPVSA